MAIEWDELELCLAILGVLLAARKDNPRWGAVTTVKLMALLNPHVEQLQDRLDWLVQQKLVTGSEGVFAITVDGVDYLQEYLSTAKASDSVHSGKQPPPWPMEGRFGKWFPDGDPDDPSRVPLKRKPAGGGSEIALPLPESGEFQK